MHAHTTPLKFLMPGWFAVVMGLVGLSLAWHAAQPAMGEGAVGVSLALGVVAAAVFAVVLALSVWRLGRYPDALAEDLRHPVRHGFVAALPVALLLLATWAAALGWVGAGVQLLWWLGSLLQLAATVWVLRRWLEAAPAGAPGASPAGAGGASPPAPFWPTVTPVLLIPVVGNVLAPLAGGALGAGVWAMAQFGIGLLLWPVVVALLLVRRAAVGPLPQRLLPTWFITVAPPSVVGLVALQQQLPVGATLLWGMALFFLVWVGQLAKQALAQPFALPFWGMSFPLAAFAALTLKLAAALASPWLQGLGLVALALASLVIASLVLGTVKGLRDGSLLAPEPAAPIQPAQP